MADVSHGRNMQGVKKGEITKLLVLEQLPKPAGNMGGWHHPISMGHPYAGSGDGTNNCGTFTLKRILGTVPVETDGSAHIELPALRSLFFVALDQNDVPVKRMQSFVTLQPGEVTSCVGCHEQRTNTPLPTGDLAALKRPASQVQPIANVPEVLDFPRDIQPILDEHCVACHDYQPTAEGGSRDGNVILSGDHGPWFSHAFATLTVLRQFADGRNGSGNRAPRSTGSAASPLMEKLDGQHYDAKLSAHQRTMIRLWIETSAAYPGTYAACGSGMVDIHDHNDATTHRWDTITELGIYRPRGSINVPAPRETLDRRCNGCHAQSVPLHPQLLYNLTRPEKSMVLLAPLSKAAGGLGLCNPTTCFTTTTDPDYQTILAFLVEASQALTKIKRFDMPGFQPPDEYITQMQSYGILDNEADPKQDKLNPYHLDQSYWQSLWHQPDKSP